MRLLNGNILDRDEYWDEIISEIEDEMPS